MKITTNGKWLLVVAVAMLCLAPSALAQVTLSTSFGTAGDIYCCFNYGGGGAFQNDGTFQVQVGGGPTYTMISDDFTSPFNKVGGWTANGNSFSLAGVIAGDCSFSGSSEGTLTVLQQYDNYAEALALSYAMLFNPGGINSSNGGAAVAALAIEYLFEPAAVGSISNCTGTVGGCSALMAQINNWIAWAAANQSYGQSGNWVIWTPVGCANIGAADNCQNGSELFQFVPEGGAALLYLLLAGVSCFGAMFFRSRHQHARPGMA
jgi:hypothetical protein